MGDDSPPLNRGLFGYRRSAVKQIISDRDMMLRQAEGRVRASQARIAELEAKLEALRGQNVRREDELRALETRLEDLAIRTGAPTAGPTASVAVLEEAAAAVQEALSQREADEPDEVSDYEATPAYEAVTYEAEPAARSEAQESSYGGLEYQDEEADAIEAEPTGEETAFVQPAAEPDVRLEEESVAEETGDELGSVAAAMYQPDEEMGDSADFGAEARFPESEEMDAMEDRPAMTSDEEMAAYAEAPSPNGEVEAPMTPSGDESFGEDVLEPGMAAPGPAAGEAPSQPESYGYPAPSPAAQAPAAPAQPAGGMTSQFLTEELARILSAAEESAARIMERARVSSQAQMTESNRLWREVQAEVTRFHAWREQVEPLIHQVQSKVEDVRSKIDEVPERIREALAPMADSIASVDGDLADLLVAAGPPMLFAPRGLGGEAPPEGEAAQELTGLYGGQADPGSEGTDALRGLGGELGDLGAEMEALGGQPSQWQVPEEGEQSY
jgi:peptidoglycan hydrolase CwlO-like protein